MANRLAMDKVQAISSLRATGMSQRRIAEALGISRKAVRRHLGRISPKDTKAPTGEAPTGSPDVDEAKDTKAPTGSESPPNPVVESCRSLCRAYREAILAKLEQGLTAQRIYQDLRQEQGFPGKYSSVRRFVRQLSAGQELPFRRLEVEPGYEMQVDYGTGARCQDQDGKPHRTHVFRLVLSYSRKGYRQYCSTLFHQTSPSRLSKVVVKQLAPSSVRRRREARSTKAKNETAVSMTSAVVPSSPDNEFSRNEDPVTRNTAPQVDELNRCAFFGLAPR